MRLAQPSTDGPGPLGLNGVVHLGLNYGPRRYYRSLRWEASVVVSYSYKQVSVTRSFSRDLLGVRTEVKLLVKS